MLHRQSIEKLYAIKLNRKAKRMHQEQMWRRLFIKQIEVSRYVKTASASFDSSLKL